MAARLVQGQKTTHALHSPLNRKKPPALFILFYAVIVQLSHASLSTSLKSARIYALRKVMPF